MNLTEHGILAIAAVAILLAGCGKEAAISPASTGTPIEFRLGTDTRATLEQLGVNTSTLSGATVIVNGTKNSANTYNDLILLPETDKDNSDRWFPNGNNKWEDWASGSAYTFIGYAYYPTNATTITPNGSDKLLTVSSYGNITVHQPTSYTYGSENSTMVDYMLSHKFTVSDGGTKPIVRLLFEHAMSLVQIYVVKDPSIAGVEVLSLSLNDFFTQADMVCSNPLPYTDNGYNSWAVTYPGYQDGDYQMSGSFTVMDSNTEYTDLTNRTDSNPAVMQLLAVPQALAGNSAKPTITVKYSVNEQVGEAENWVEHDEVSFALAENEDLPSLPTVWESGYRYRYVITVDTGIKLTAHVEAWKDGGMVEATILPNI